MNKNLALSLPIYFGRNDEVEQFLDDIIEVVKKSGSLLEGNSFYHHQTTTRYDALFTKQVNLFWVGTTAQTRICEIGLNASHSAMLLLLARDRSVPFEFTIFDIGQHKYTKPCFEILKSKFSSVNFEYIEGDSTIEMPKFINSRPETAGSYDIVHVDGGHSVHCIRNDMMNADILVRVGGILIIDDTYMEHIDQLVNSYIYNGTYAEVSILPTAGYTHRMIRKIK